MAILQVAAHHFRKRKRFADTVNTVEKGNVIWTRQEFLNGLAL
jgi:hypothetical protein